jgi:hypothetical protein
MSEEIRGLAAIKEMQRKQKEAQEARERPKAEWFKWPKGVTTATALFLQEMDEGAAGYKPERDLGFIQVEHQAPGPEGYKRRANCTHESEGECYACERHAQDYKEGWRQRSNLYINALVDFGQGEGPQVVVIQRNANSSFVQALIEEAVEENTITANNYKITKVGEGTTTQWLLKGLKDRFDDSAVEVYNLKETAVRAIPYEKQAEYYGAVYSGGASSSEETSGGTSSVDAEW